MNLASISKGIAGGIATATGGTGTAWVVIPPEVAMPWYGYLAVALINAAIGFAMVYKAPANRP